MKAGRWAVTASVNGTCMWASSVVASSKDAALAKARKRCSIGNGSNATVEFHATEVGSVVLGGGQ